LKLTQQGDILISYQKTMNYVLGFLFAASFIILSINLGLSLREKVEVQDLKQNYEYGITLIQKLDAGIDPILKRQNDILKFRDVIMLTNPKVDLNLAYQIASDNYDLSDKYKVDPNLLLALQRQESQFNTRAVSPMGALGLNQIMPQTGRLLCAALHWSYSDSILYDSKTSTELACLYLQISMMSYSKQELVLASYNGGHIQAHYYNIGSGKIAAETKEYVFKVMKFYKELTSS
jgi:soluble lytic murein transglycosylase-like protein